MTKPANSNSMGFVGSPARVLLSAATTVLPWSLRRRVLQRVFGWEIHPTARIGLSLFMGVAHVRLDENAAIGSFNMFRNLRRVEVGANSHIGQWNWISTGADFAAAPEPGGEFHIGRDSSLTARHYVDCSGGVLIGNYSTIAGQRTTIMTHEIDLEANVQRVRPVEVGNHVLVNACCLLVPGTVIPDRSAVAGGAVVTGVLKEPALYAGVPAVKKRPSSGAFFERVSGWVKFEPPSS